NFQYQLFDATGRVLLAGENQNRLDIAHLQPGIYLLQVIQDGRNYEAKIIKS
ncbi:MAG: T9SS type A sorting domain-containing protein, partial [Bacteroidales bacterium]|nr:T9SS type A sorting domain-containing protein [Bacteroidales bacterium]